VAKAPPNSQKIVGLINPASETYFVTSLTRKV